jgi:hypothetical protein
LVVTGRIVDTIQCVELTRRIPTGNQAKETPKNMLPEDPKNEVSKSNQSPEDAGDESIGEAGGPRPESQILRIQNWTLATMVTPELVSKHRESRIP